MEVKQIYELVNNIEKEHFGESAILKEDLSNIVDVGKKYEDLFDDDSGYDHYVNKLIDHIGKVVVVDRKYSPRAKSVLMDGWEFGAILEKIYPKLPQAQENESWELVDGASYDTQIFYKPSVEARFYNKRITFEVPMSFTRKQVKSAFSNATQMNAFISMIYTAISNKLTLSLDDLIMRTINNMIAETVYDEYGSSAISSKSTVKAVNLLYLYNATLDTPITAAEAITNKDFIRFSAGIIKNYKDKLNTYSKLFNIEKEARFTTDDRLHVIMLSEFANNADVYLQSDVFHDSFTKLPNAEKVSFWQATGEAFGFSDTSKIYVKTASGNDVTVTGVLCAMFDRDALGVSNLNQYVTSAYNAKGDFVNEYHKVDAGYFNSLSENMVVFFVA